MGSVSGGDGGGRGIFGRSGRSGGGSGWVIFIDYSGAVPGIEQHVEAEGSSFEQGRSNILPPPSPQHTHAVNACARARTYSSRRLNAGNLGGGEGFTAYCVLAFGGRKHHISLGFT